MIAVRGSICAKVFIIGAGAVEGVKPPWAPARKTANPVNTATAHRTHRVAFIGHASLFSKTARTPPAIRPHHQFWSPASFSVPSPRQGVNRKSNKNESGRRPGKGFRTALANRRTQVLGCLRVATVAAHPATNGIGWESRAVAPL